jgi:hypothetical protein
MLKITPFLRPPLDPEFLPAALWNRAYRAVVATDPGRALVIVLERPDGGVSRHQSRVLGRNHPESALSLRYAERLLKFLLWQKGGCTVRVAGAPEIAAHLASVYSPTGPRAFDYAFMGDKVYGRTFSVGATKAEDLPEERDTGLPMGRHLGLQDRVRHRGKRPEGGRGHRRPCGRVSDEVPMGPVLPEGPGLPHRGDQRVAVKAAAHLPRVDAIGGSAAGST